jgi:hypothetical protein
MDEIEKRWTKEAQTQLLGRRIVKVRYMKPSEAEMLGWHFRPVVLQLDDGNLVFPSSDDEGNEPGSFFTNNEQQPVLPII